MPNELTRVAYLDYAVCVPNDLDPLGDPNLLLKETKGRLDPFHQDFFR